MHSTVRKSCPVFILILAAALLAARTGSAQSVSYLSSYLNYNGGHYVDGAAVSETSGTPVANAERGVISLGHGFPDVNRSMSTHARPGFLRVFNSALSSHTGPTPPQTFKFFHGTGQAEFGDYLTITSLDPNRPWTSVTLRTRWRRSGTLSLQISAVPEPWGGTRPNGTVSYSWSPMGQGAEPGSLQRGQYATETTQAGNLEAVQMVTIEVGASLGSPRLIQADMRVATTMGSPETLDCSAEGTGSITVELVSIEVLDYTGALLPVKVISASGHVYPVVQPPVPGLPALHLTAQSISRDSGSVMFSFASETGASYRVLGSTSLGLADPWQVLTTLTGQPSVSIATFSDPDATTQPSRFYKIERITE